MLNAYCLTAVLIVSQLRKVDFAFVHLQNAVDLLAGGLANSIFTYFQANYQLREYCMFIKRDLDNPDLKYKFPEGRLVIERILSFNQILIFDRK